MKNKYHENPEPKRKYEKKTNIRKLLNQKENIYIKKKKKQI